jgi:signal transduction histidine kinase
VSVQYDDEVTAPPWPSGEALTAAVLQPRIRRVLAAMIAMLRVIAVALAAVTLASGLRDGGYSMPPLAISANTVVGCWSVMLVVVALRKGSVPGWLCAADVAVVAACVLALGHAVHPSFFADNDNSDLNPVMNASAVTVAMSWRVRWAVVGCAVLSGAHVAAEVPVRIASHTDLLGVAVDVFKLGAAALAAGLTAHWLSAAAAQVDTAAREIATLRAQSAEQRARAEERHKHSREQIRRYRELHDGPLFLLTAIGNRSLTHRDREVSTQCAINANLLRGLISTDPQHTLTDLALSLIKTGGSFAAHGLRIDYQLSQLPADLPPKVVEALTGAAREALNNVVAHAGIDRASLTAITPRHPDHGAVVVTVVDQGGGFDHLSVPAGRGLADCITGRMTDVGGAATIDSVPGHGTRIELRWPR